jgi:hypothetical protein
MFSHHALGSSSSLLRSSALLGLLLALPACDPGDPALDDTEIGQAPLTFTNLPGQNSPFLYDSGSQCSIGTSGLAHCCPIDMVMTGVNLSQNRFKCALVDGGILTIHGDGWFGDTVTQRNGMHACPFGEAMVGYFHGSPPWNQETLLCGRLRTKVASEHVDGNPATSDGQMHVCPDKDLNGRQIANPARQAMTGIHAGNNLFNCGS